MERAMPSTRDRVPAHTDDDINRSIQQAIEDNIHYYERRRGEIPARLHELDQEWDIERALEANAAAIGFIGVALGAHDRRWLALPALVTAFLFQHAVQGWCPPVPVMRRLGFRTSYEIEQERQALKALRGDYEDVPSAPDPASAAMEAARV
jgi:hypothetical protein